MAACVVLVPFSVTTTNLLLLTAGLGAFTAVTFSVVAKLFKLLPVQCYGYFVAGSSVASVVAIGLSFCTGLSKGTPASGPSYETYCASAGLLVLGAISGVLLVFSRLGRYYMEQGRIDLDMSAAGSFRTDGTAWAVACRTWSSQLALAILVTPTVAVAGLVGFIPAQTDTWRNPGFSAVLVFVIMVSVIIGRQLRCRASVDGPWSPSGGALVSWGLLRLLLGGAIVTYAAQPKLEGSGSKMVLNDAALIAALVVFSASGGALIPYVFESGTSKVHAQASGKLDTIHGTVGCASCIAGLVAALCVAYVLGGRSVFELPISARSFG